MSLKQEIHGGERFALKFGHTQKRLGAMLLWHIQNQPQFGENMLLNNLMTFGFDLKLEE